MAVCTSTGNHDWRSYPYQLVQLGYHEEFGLTHKESLSSTFRGFSLEEFRQYEKANAADPDILRSSFRIPSIIGLVRLVRKGKLIFGAIVGIEILLLLTLIAVPVLQYCLYTASPEASISNFVRFLWDHYIVVAFGWLSLVVASIYN